MSPVTLSSLAFAALVGATSGTHAAIWGTYKDAVHEGFGPWRFARSIVIGAAAGVALQGALALPLPSAAALVLLFALAYAVERGVTEVWKTFVRQEDQRKYTIPMQLSVGGVPVAHRGARLVAGVAYVGVVALAVRWLLRLDAAATSAPHPAAVALTALAAGLFVAVGGGWKDAPTEGFELLKFFRSPAMTVAFALVLAPLTGSLLLLAVGTIGFERATVETWKTFGRASRPPGKFAGKPVLHPALYVRRRRLVPVYVAIWMAVLVCGAIAFLAPAAGAAPVMPTLALR